MKYPLMLPYMKTADQGKELKYSLRSLENMTNFNGEVTIVGDSEVWFNNINHIKLRRAYGYIYLDQILKTKLALEYMPETFIASQDDIYIMQTTEIGLYHQGELKGEGNGVHKKSKANTRKLLIEMGVENPLDFEVHYPQLVNRDELAKVFDIILAHPLKTGLQWRSIYGNLYGQNAQLVEDYKTKTNLLKEGDIVSTNHYTPELHMHFPVESPFEIGNIVV